ncbi:hypothetical protein ACWD4V_18585 [Streptomyces tsukubensis]|uniref:hypothetical protein n=1 Tax=Streptomyces tsukubensis TaxID=83656 RepID=UPI00369F046A
MAEPHDGPPADTAENRDDNTAVEHELRVLLARTVPNLPTPLDRMGQVKERVRRRRSRQRAWGAALAVAVLAGGGLLLPGALSGEGGDPRPLVAETAERESGPVTPAAPRRAQRTVVHPGLAGMELSLPVEWQTLTMPDIPAHRGIVGNNTLYLSTQPLARFPTPCTGKTRCTPVEQLRPDGVLVQFQMASGAQVPEKTRRLGKPLIRNGEMYTACKDIGGAYDYSGAIGGVPHPDSPVFVSVCAGPDMPEGRLQEITGFMAKAVFRGTGKPSAAERDAPPPAGTALDDPATQTPDRPGTRASDRPGTRAPAPPGTQAPVPPGSRSADPPGTRHGVP